MFPRERCVICGRVDLALQTNYSLFALPSIHLNSQIIYFLMGRCHILSEIKTLIFSQMKSNRIIEPSMLFYCSTWGMISNLKWCTPWWQWEARRCRPSSTSRPSPQTSTTPLYFLPAPLPLPLLWTLWALWAPAPAPELGTFKVDVKIGSNLFVLALFQIAMLLFNANCQCLFIAFAPVQFCQLVLEKLKELVENTRAENGRYLQYQRGAKRKE